jgi:hypothetical protein
VYEFIIARVIKTYFIILNASLPQNDHKNFCEYQHRLLKRCQDTQHNDTQYNDTQHNNKNVGLSLMTLSITTLNITTLNITTLSITTLSIITISTMTLNTFTHRIYSECHNHVLSVKCFLYQMLLL